MILDLVQMQTLSLNISRGILEEVGSNCSSYFDLYLIQCLSYG